MKASLHRLSLDSSNSRKLLFHNELTFENVADIMMLPK